MMRVVLALTLLTGVFVQAQTAQPGEATSPHAIVCIGDSITFGYGSASGGFPTLMQEMFGPGFRVHNLGLSRATLGKRDKGKLGNLRPEVIVIKLGTNDALPQNWANCRDEFGKNYGDFVDSLNTLIPKPRIYLVLPVPRFDKAEPARNLADEIVPIIRKVAADKGVELIDCHTPFLDQRKLFVDGLHPADAGQTMLARIVYRSLTTVDKARVKVIDDKIEQYLSTPVGGRLQVSAQYTSGLADDAAVRDCRFSSLDPAVAGVSERGILTAKTVGAVRVRVDMPGFTDTVTLQVVPNRTPPGVESVSASQPDPRKVSVVFTEPMERASAEAIGNYTLSKGASVIGASLSEDERAVTLDTAPLIRLATYTLSVSGVKDKAGNALPANTAMNFKHLPIVPLRNPGFETPALAPNRDFQYAPTNAAWTFAGNKESGSIGIDRPPDGAPEGAQLAHINRNGRISQSVHFEHGGDYELLLMASSRSLVRASTQILIDDAKIADFPAPRKCIPFVFRFSVPAGEHKLTFARSGLEQSGLGYIDDVRILPADPDLPPKK